MLGTGKSYSGTGKESFGRVDRGFRMIVRDRRGKAGICVDEGHLRKCVGLVHGWYERGGFLCGVFG